MRPVQPKIPSRRSERLGPYPGHDRLTALRRACARDLGRPRRAGDVP